MNVVKKALILLALISSTAFAEHGKFQADAARTLGDVPVTRYCEWRSLRESQESHSFKTIDVIREGKDDTARIKLVGKVYSDTVVDGKHLEPFGEDKFNWSLKVAPPWTGEFKHEKTQFVNAIDGQESKNVQVQVSHYSSVEGEPKDGFKVTEMKIISDNPESARTIHIVRSAPFLMDKGRGGDETLIYYTITLFDDKGNFVQTYASVPKQGNDRRSKTLINISTGAGPKYCRPESGGDYFGLPLGEGLDPTQLLTEPAFAPPPGPSKLDFSNFADHKTIYPAEGDAEAREKYHVLLKNYGEALMRQVASQQGDKYKSTLLYQIRTQIADLVSP